MKSAVACVYEAAFARASTSRLLLAIRTFDVALWRYYAPRYDTDRLRSLGVVYYVSRVQNYALIESWGDPYSVWVDAAHFLLEYGCFGVEKRSASADLDHLLLAGLHCRWTRSGGSGSTCITRFASPPWPCCLMSRIGHGGARSSIRFSSRPVHRRCDGYLSPLNAGRLLTAIARKNVVVMYHDRPSYFRSCGLVTASKSCNCGLERGQICV